MLVFCKGAIDAGKRLSKRAGRVQPISAYSTLADRIAVLTRFGAHERTNRIVVLLNPRAGKIDSRRRLNRVSAQVVRAISGSGPALSGGARSRRFTGADFSAETITGGTAAEEAPAARASATSLPAESRVTAGPGDGRRIGCALGREALSRGERLLLVSAGGDGSHSEVMSGLLDAGREACGLCTVHRVPLGTGNDGSDAESVEASLAILRDGGAVVEAPALEVTGPGLAVRYAFNIASFGLDAYVSYLTNLLKRRVPGDTYKIIADIATLFYEPLFGVPEQELRVISYAGEAETVVDRFMLCAVGVSGYRSYGAGKPILPTDANLCGIQRVGLRGKLRLKRLVYAGAHLADPAVFSRSVREVTIRTDQALPMQLDGEASRLSPKNFPVRCSIVPGVIRVLRSFPHPRESSVRPLDSSNSAHTDSPL